MGTVALVAVARGEAVADGGGGKEAGDEEVRSSKVFVSEVLVVNSGGLEMSKVSSLMGRVRQRADMERIK